MVAQQQSPKGVVLSIVLVFLFTIANLAFAETKVFVEEYTYQASEYDSKVSCRALALEQVKRLLLEKLGTYLESDTEVKNFQLTKDQIVILTAGIVTAEIIDEKWDGKTYYLKAKISAAPKDVAKSIDKLRHDRQKTKELEETKKKADEALREVEKLRKELEISKAGKVGQDQYRKAVNGLSAIDWVEKGYILGVAGRYQEEIEAYTRAIELDPKYGIAYCNRCFGHNELGDHWLAIKDCDRAIELNPKDSMAYVNRGVSYRALGDEWQAIKEFDKAIELDSKFVLAYMNRGVSCANLGDHRQAIRDYNRAIELNPKDGLSYYNRGVSHIDLGHYQEAIRDLQFPAQLGCKPAQDYLRSKGISW